MSRLTAEWLFSNDILRVVPSSEHHAGWLYAFLRSRTAFRLIRSLATGSKQQDLHPAKVPLIPVLQGSEDDYRTVNRLIAKAFRLRDEAYQLENGVMAELERMVKEAL